MTVFELEQKCMELACFSQRPPKFWKYSQQAWNVFCFSYQILVIVVTLYIIFGEFLFIYRNFHEIYEVTACVAPLIAHVLNLSKLYTLWLQNARIHVLIDELRRMVAEEKDSKYQKMLHKVNRHDQLVCRVIIALYVTLTVLYALKPILLNFFYVFVYRVEPSYEMPTISAYLFDETVSPAYEISYAVCVFCLVSSCGIHIASDTSFICCFLNIACHFEILGEMVLDVDMRTFINYHRKVLDLSRELNSLFEATVFGEYLLCGMLMCVNGFQLVMVHDPGKFIIAACFGLTAVFTLLIYAYGGQEIMDKSTQVCDRVYEINKDYWFITMRVQRPVTIRAGFFHACLPTYTTILNSAGSMITLLKSFV